MGPPGSFQLLMTSDAKCPGYLLPVTGTGIANSCLACDFPMEPLSAGSNDGYFFCRHCHLVRVWPSPSEETLQRYYADFYQVDRENYMRGIKRNGKRLLNALSRQNAAGRLLEIGSSWGGFLTLAASHGWKVAGVELSPETARWAEERGGHEVHCGSLASSPFVGRGQFDVVVAWHVIEHLVDPLEFLRQVYSCLKPGGIMALRTPNIASFVAQVNGRLWEWFEAPTHLTLFSPRGLAKLVERAGFRAETIGTSRGDAHNPWVEILRGTMVRAGAKTHLKKLLGWQEAGPSSGTQARESVGGRASRRVRMWTQLDRSADVALFFLYPAELALNLSGRGSEIFLLARRADGAVETQHANL
jgi:2-polyprenyl-3-methyl-5-hydroxy-6-metoxy-1,4-benzoquinol methylase